MKKLLMILMFFMLFILLGCSTSTKIQKTDLPNKVKVTTKPQEKATNETIVWLGKGQNWNYEIKLIHKPNDQVQFISHGQIGLNPCEAPNYAVEVSEGVIYKGHKGGKFTSFKAVYEGSPPYVSQISEMKNGMPKGIEGDKPYGTQHSACFTISEWERMKTDLTNTEKVTVTAYPYDNSTETITLSTAK